MPTTRKQQPPKQQQNPEELIEVAFTTVEGTRYPAVKLPRRLIGSGTQRAKQEYLISRGEIPDPNAPEMPALVDEVISDAATNTQAAADLAVQHLRAQLDELQGKLDGQPLSHAELVAARQDLAEFMLKAADANSQLVQVEGRGSQIKSELSAIATPLNEQASETARRQEENEEVQQRVLSELQAQAQSLLENLTQSAAAIRAEALEVAETNAVEVATKEGRKAARQVAEAFRPSSVTIASEDPRDVDEDSWALRHYGFEGGLVAGDGVFVTGSNGITAMVYKGSQIGWVETAELLPRVVTATGPSILDQSKPQFSTVVQSSKGSSGGPSSLRLMASKAARGSSVLIADTSNYAAVNLGGTPRSGKLLVQVTDTGTALVGVCTIDFILNAAGGIEQTDSALIGNLFNGAKPPAVDLQGSLLTRPQIPTGIAAPPAVTMTTPALRLFITVGANVGTGGPYLLAGDLTLALEGGATPVDPKKGIVPAPLWVWS